MSLLHAVRQNEQAGPTTISLEGLPTDNAINMLSNVQKYGHEIAPEIAATTDYVNEVELAAAGVMRSAIDRAVPSMVSKDVAEQLLAQEIDDTLLPSHEQSVIEDAEYRQALRHSFEVESDELAFMARCVLRGAVRSEDVADRRQSQLTLDWLEQNDHTAPAVERAMHPATAKSKQVVYAAGKAMLAPLRARPKTTARGLRTRAS